MIEVTKICTKCGKEKLKNKDFYYSKGLTRGECKKCTIRTNSIYQKKNKTWRNRFGDIEKEREYMRAYREKNKDKIQSHAKKFKEKNPEYFKNYARQKKEK